MHQAVGSGIVILLLLWLLGLIWLRPVGLLGVQVGLLLLDGRSVWVVCKIALVGEARVHTRLCGTPYLLLALGIGKGLWEGRGRGGIGAALVSSEVLSSLEAKVELQPVGLLLVVGVHACYVDRAAADGSRIRAAIDKGLADAEEVVFVDERSKGGRESGQCLVARLCLQLSD